MPQDHKYLKIVSVYFAVLQLAKGIIPMKKVTISFISKMDFQQKKGIMETDFRTNYAFVGLNDITLVDEEHNIFHPVLSLLNDLADSYKKNLTFTGKEEAVKLLRKGIEDYYSDFITVSFPVNHEYQRQLVFYIIEHFCRYGAETNSTEYLYENALLDFLKTRNVKDFQDMVESYPDMDSGKDYGIPYIEESINKIMNLIPFLRQTHIGEEKHSYKWLFDMDIKDIFVEWSTESHNCIGRYYIMMIVNALADICTSNNVEYDFGGDVDNPNNRNWINLDTGEFKISGIPINRSILSPEQYKEEYRKALSKYENHGEELKITDYVCHDNQNITFIVNGLEILLGPIYVGSGMAANYPSGADICVKLNLGYGDFWKTVCSYYQFTNKEYNDDDTLYYIKRWEELDEEQNLPVNISLPIIAYELIQKHLYDKIEDIKYMTFNKKDLPYVPYGCCGITAIRYNPYAKYWDISIREDDHPWCREDPYVEFMQVVEDYRFLVLEDWISNIFGKRKHYIWGYISLDYDFDPHIGDTRVSRIRIHYPSLTKRIEAKPVEIEGFSGQMKNAFESPDGGKDIIQPGNIRGGYVGMDAIDIYRLDIHDNFPKDIKQWSGGAPTYQVDRIDTCKFGIIILLIPILCCYSSV